MLGIWFGIKKNLPLQTCTLIAPQGVFLSNRFEAVNSNVRVEGLEPPRLAAPDPKSGTSTNFAIPA
jgi:hypothetical protein